MKSFMDPGVILSFRLRLASGFTLFELLLTAVLLVFLLGALSVNWMGVRDGAKFEEGVRRFETMLRFSRAEAAASGKRVRIEFAPVAAAQESVVGDVLTPGRAVALRMSWEDQPLVEPGVFSELGLMRSTTESLLELVRVESISPIRSTEVATEATDAEFDALVEKSIGPSLDAEVSRLAILFYPDGSSNSVDVTLAPVAAGDLRRVKIRLFGPLGVFRRLPETFERLPRESAESSTETLPNDDGSTTPAADSVGEGDPAMTTDADPSTIIADDLDSPLVAPDPEAKVPSLTNGEETNAVTTIPGGLPESTPEGAAAIDPFSPAPTSDADGIDAKPDDR